MRVGTEDGIDLTTYGRSSGFCIDPIEKKPLNHFYPGTPVLSFGTAGCNLGCKFCQNWDISKSREVDTLADGAKPELVAQVAKKLGLDCCKFGFTGAAPITTETLECVCVPTQGRAGVRRGAAYRGGVAGQHQAGAPWGALGWHPGCAPWVRTRVALR